MRVKANLGPDTTAVFARPFITPAEVKADESREGDGINFVLGDQWLSVTLNGDEVKALIVAVLDMSL